MMTKVLKYITRTNFFLFAISLFSSFTSLAQLPQQNEEMLYILVGKDVYPSISDPTEKSNFEIWNYDPKLSISSNNPYKNIISPPNTDSFRYLIFGDLAVGPNLYGDGPEYTFYITRTARRDTLFPLLVDILYYNGSDWKIAEYPHRLGLSLPYLFPLDVIQDEIYTLTYTSGGFAHVKHRASSTWDTIDLISYNEYRRERKEFNSIDVDCEANVYLFESHNGRDSSYTQVNGFTRVFRKYNASGLFKEWKVVNAPISEGWPFNPDTLPSHHTYHHFHHKRNAVNKDKVYFTTDSFLYVGVVGEDEVVCSPVFNLFTYFPFENEKYIYDLASITTFSLPFNDRIDFVPGLHDTLALNCKRSNASFPLTASGEEPITWKVGSGSAYIQGSGKNVTVDLSSPAVIYASAPYHCNASGEIVDTFVFINPEIKAGFELTELKECGKKISLSTENTSSGLTENYHWDFGDGTTSTEFEPTHDYFLNGHYDISLIAYNEWCADTFTKKQHHIDIGRDDFELSIYIDTADVYAGEVIELKAEANQSFNVLSWNPVELFTDQQAYEQQFVIFETQTFSIRAISVDDCVDTANLEVRVHPINTDIFMPNAFSPNGDGLNDEFGPELLIHRGYVISDFSIHNRNGQVVFHNRGSYNKKWDGTLNGKDCAIGVYYYYLKIRFQDGTNKEIKGEVTLVR